MRQPQNSRRRTNAPQADMILDCIPATLPLKPSGLARSLVALAVVIGLCFVAGRAMPVRAQGAAPIVIPAKFDTGTEHVLIPVTIGGRQFWCNPDTGYSAIIALDQAKAMAAGLRVGPGIPTADGNPPAPGDRSTTATVVVGGSSFPDYPIIVRPFAEPALDMDCIMGVALLRRFVVEFDHVTPRLLLHDRGTYRPPPDMQRVPIVFGPNPTVPYVDIEMTLTDGTRLPLRVVPDTGAAFYGAALVGAAAARVRALERHVPALTYPDPQPGRIIQLLAARPAAIRVGAVTLERPIVAFVEGSLGGGAIADGVLGSGFFWRFTTVFDFDGRAIYLKPNERMRQPARLEGSWIGFLRRGGRRACWRRAGRRRWPPGLIPDSAAAPRTAQRGWCDAAAAARAGRPANHRRHSARVASLIAGYRDRSISCRSCRAGPA